MSAAMVKESVVATTPAVGCLEAVAQSFGAERARIVVRCELEVRLSPAQVEPVTRITRDAIQNALRYAYPDGAPGKIWVSLDEVRGRMTLSIRDSGVGFPVD